MIRIDGLTKTYRGGQVRALDGVSLTIGPGEVFGVIGPNGAGKTTLVGCLLGFLRPDAGRVTIEDREPDDLAIRAVTGYLPERLVLDRWMSGWDFLAYHHALARLPAERRAAEVEAALANVEIDRGAWRRGLRGYSRGMLQRLGLAQALLGEPRYVFLDEPASGVDPAGVVLFRRLLGGLKRRGMTVVLNSHHLDQVERVCDRVAYVSRGRVEAVETLAAGAALARVLRVRWSTRAGSPAVEVLERAAAGAGGALQSLHGAEAHFALPDDDAAARLIALLVGAGVSVIEAAPEESRLERLFLQPSGGAAS